MKLKLCTTGKLFGKICLKAVKILFSSMWSAMKRGMGWGMKERGWTQFFGGEWRSTEGWDSKSRTWMGRVLSWSSIKNILRSVLGLDTVIILKRLKESIFSFEATYLQHVRLQLEKRRQNLWWCSIYVRLSIHFKIRSIQGLSET